MHTDLQTEIIFMLSVCRFIIVKFINNLFYLNLSHVIYTFVTMYKSYILSMDVPIYEVTLRY